MKHDGILHRLLKHRSVVGASASWWPAVALLVFGMLLRAALYFPPAMFQIDSDAVIAGLCAFRVGDGYYPIFLPGGTRVGAASCYVTAGYFHLFGAQRSGLALTALTWELLYLIFSLLFLRAMLVPAKAFWAFLFAVVPSEQFMTVTYAPWGYGEIAASCAATLWFAALWRNDNRLWRRVGFGLGVGIGLWFSLQTLMIAVPSYIWIALARRRAVIRESFAAGLAVVVGAAPFVIANAIHGFPSLTQNWASRPAGDMGLVWGNFIWLLIYLLPKLLVQRIDAWWSLSTILVAGYLSVSVGFGLAIFRDSRTARTASYLRDATLLLGLVFAACILFFSFSQAGTIRGWTVRYIMPLYVVVPLFCGIGVAALARRRCWLAVLVVATMWIPNLMFYALPGSALRSDLTRQLSDDIALRTTLTDRHVRLLYGNYVWVYHVNFDTKERVAAVPIYAPFDYGDYGAGLGTQSVGWAALGSLAEVRAWARTADAKGTFQRNDSLWLFIARRPATAANLLARLRSAAP